MTLNVFANRPRRYAACASESWIARRRCHLKLLMEVARPTHAENGTVLSDYVTSDPWDNRRQPRERILSTAQKELK